VRILEQSEESTLPSSPKSDRVGGCQDVGFGSSPSTDLWEEAAVPRLRLEAATEEATCDAATDAIPPDCADVADLLEEATEPGAE